MAVASTGRLKRPVAVPADLGEPLWREQRRFPVLHVLGAPVVILAALALAVHPAWAHALLGAAAAVALGVALRVRRRRGLVETAVVTARWVAVAGADDARLALPLATLRRAVVHGDSVRLEGDDGVLTLGFVRRQRALLRALARGAPGLVVEHDADLACPT